MNSALNRDGCDSCAERMCRDSKLLIAPVSFAACVRKTVTFVRNLIVTYEANVTNCKKMFRRLTSKSKKRSTPCTTLELASADAVDNETGTETDTQALVSIYIRSTYSSINSG